MIPLNYFTISLFLGSLIAFGSGIVAYYRNKRSLVNKTWLRLNLATAIWSFGYFIMIASPIQEISWYGNWMLHAAAVILPSLYIHFILALTGKLEKYKKILYLSYALSTLFFIFNPTKLFVKDVIPKYIFNYVCDAGPLYIFFTIHFFVSVLFALFVLYREIRSRLGIASLQLKYVFISSLLGFTGGGSVFFLTFNINIPPYPVILFALYPLVITYVIIRYRFMDVRSVVFRSFIFSVTVSLIMALYSFIFSFLGLLFYSVFGFKSNFIVSLFIGLSIVIGYQPLRKMLERVSNKVFFKLTYDPSLLLTQITKATSSIIDLQLLLKSVCELINNAFHCQKIGFILTNKIGELKVGYQDGFAIKEIENLLGFKNISKILKKEIAKSPEALVIDEMKIRYENKEFKPVSPKLLMEIYNYDIALILPLFIKDRFIGAFVLGNKKAGDPYSSQDLKTLEIIAGQSAISIDNASLYEELKGFNIKLQKEVKKATAKLEVANKELQRLDQSKSEFLSIASHQLRTPLTVIKGYSSMILEGSFGRVPKLIKENMDKVFNSTERLIALVENLLNVSRIEAGRIQFDLEPVDLESVVKVFIDDFTPKAEAKKIKLSFYPEKKLPKVLADPQKIKDVVSNLLDNSIKYTPTGEITVSLHLESQSVVFACQDTGMGIDPNDLPRLFNKFVRGTDMNKVQTDGTGLGLYYARMIVENMGGRIWAESNGKGKGSKFCFSLNLANKGEANKIK